MRILVIEDNPDIAANLASYLGARGYVLDFAASGYAGLALAAQNDYDVLVLDVGLPGIDGFELCRRIRRELGKSTPVLMLTARDAVEDKVTGFESGADDYLVKPYSVVELEARLKALVRRVRGGAVAGVLRVGDLSYNERSFEARHGDKPLVLTKTGCRILASLMRASPDVVTREQLEADIWGEDRPESDALRTHIHAVRRALESAGAPAMLRTVQGVGYRLVKDDA